MSSLSDEIASKTINDGSKAAKNTLQASQKIIKESVKAGGTLVKGICLVILDGGAFTTENVMKAVNKAAFKKTGDIKYSKNNIDIAALQKSGRVNKIEDNVTADVMKYFDAQCKKYKMKYSAMRDDRNPEKPAYMVFFEGKNNDMILHALKEASKDYIEVQKKVQKETKEPSGQKERQSSRDKESVRAKLAFFGIGLQLGTENGMD